ncbi:S-layer homology domain-containing protein [Paenibacillus campi]|uniref:S-layer homology domain-containing protein n=1 Tax=Paenibacillus campi TaxID=3106031 RepID=UPI002AFE5CD6|nr:S-layer homology domain-containing protein [Paenibacillus sp. SGZ-1009]
MKTSKLRSHRRLSVKTGVCGWLAILLLLPSAPIHAATVAGRHEQVSQDTYLGGQYMELGIADSGTLGTSSASPGGFHPGALRKSIGLNTDHDGYDHGQEMNGGDYILPGSPSEGFIVGYKHSPSAISPRSFINEQQNGSVDIPGTTQDISTDTLLAARTVGKTRDQALGINQIISFKPGDSFYKTTITLTNPSVTDSVYDVHYMRFLDPDMDADLNNDNSTINWVPSNPPADSDAIAIAMGSASDHVFMYVASDPRAQASVGFSRDPYSAPAFQTDGAKRIDAKLADDWLTLTFNAGTLKPGASTELVFYSSVNPNLNAALAAIHADYQTVPEQIPTELALSGDELTWDMKPGANVGILTATSANPDDRFIYSLVSGEGSEGNSYFEIENNRLVTAASLVRGVSSYPVRIRVTGPQGGTLEKTFIIHAHAPESSTELTALTIDNSSLQPGFKRDVMTYHASLNADAKAITVQASVYDPDATLSVNGITVTDVVYSTNSLRYTAPLTDELTELALQVTAPSGQSKTYTVQVIPASLQAESQQPSAPIVDQTEPESSTEKSTATVPTDLEQPAALDHNYSANTAIDPNLSTTPTIDTYMPLPPALTITFPFLPELPVEPMTNIPVLISGGSGSNGAGASRLDDIITNGGTTSAAITDSTAAPTTTTVPATKANKKDTVSRSNTSATITGNGYIQGYPNGTFRPEQKVTRAELAMMLDRLIGSQNRTAGIDFKDIPASYWAASGIEWVGQQGWMQGYPDGTFQPGQALTRAELASLLSRWQELDSMDTATTTTADVQHNWAAADINKVIAAGLMKGFPDGNFYPNEPVTRAEIVTVLNRIQTNAASASTSTASNWKDVTPQHWAYAAISNASQ